MDYRNIMAMAAVIFACGYLIRSFQPANAYPQGPNVSLGSNPIESWAGKFSSSMVYTIGTVSTSFVITDFTIQGSGSYCEVQLSSSSSSLTTSDVLLTAYYGTNNSAGNLHWNGNFETGIAIPSGTTIYAHVARNGGCYYNISGYYTH